MATKRVLPKGAIKLIESSIDKLFQRLKVKFFGPGILPKRIVVQYQSNLTLPGIFNAAAREEGVKPDQYHLDNIIDVAEGYIDAVNSRTKSRAVQAVQATLSNAQSQGVKTDVLTVLNGELSNIWKETTSHIQTIVDSEISTARNVSILDGIMQSNARQGVDDPTVYFVTVRDGVRCVECTRLHLLEDKVTPRVWKLSEVGHGYHKKGDPDPKIGGLHPNCRCAVSTCMPGYGFNESGMITYISPKHDEFLAQRSLTKSLPYTPHDCEQHLSKAALDPDAGYTFAHEVEIRDNPFAEGEDDKTYQILRVNARAPDNSSAGYAAFLLRPYKTQAESVFVNKPHRRKGVASAMYAYAEAVTGQKILPGLGQTPDGKALWEGNAKLKQFGKGEALNRELELQEPEEAPTSNLLVTHNLSSAGLVHAHKLGGLAAPSLAVVNKDFPMENFGDITLIAHRDLADPKKTPVFDADIYSARQPRAKYDIDLKKIKEIHQKVYPHIQPLKGNGSSFDLSDFAENLKEGVRGVLYSGRNKNALALAFLKDVKGQQIEIPTRKKRSHHFHVPEWAEHPSLEPHLDAFLKVDSDDKATMAKLGKVVKATIAAYYKGKKLSPKLRKELQAAEEETFLDGGSLSSGRASSIAAAIQNKNLTEPDTSKLGGTVRKLLEPHEEEFEKWVHDTLTPALVKPHFRRGYNSKKIAYTLENVVKEMTRNKQIRGGEDYNYGLGSSRAFGAKKFRTLDQIRQATKKLMPGRDFEKKKEEINDKFAVLVTKLSTYHGAPNAWGKMESVANAITSHYKGRSLRAELALDGFENVPDELIEEVRELADELVAMPTEYFEAKPQRAVKISEFHGAVVPRNTSSEILQILAEHGIKDIEHYDSEGPATRVQAIQKIAQRRKLFLKEAGWSDSDLDKFEKDIIEPLSLTLYHGTSGDFDPEDIDGPAYLTANKDIAYHYATQGGDSSDGARVHAYKASLNNPLEIHGPEDLLDILPEDLRDGHEGARFSWEILKHPNSNAYHHDEVFEFLKEMGYDSLVLHDDTLTDDNGYQQPHGEPSYVVFEPDQLTPVETPLEKSMPSGAFVGRLKKLGFVPASGTNHVQFENPLTTTKFGLQHSENESIIETRNIRKYMAQMGLRMATRADAKYLSWLNEGVGKKLGFKFEPGDFVPDTSKENTRQSNNYLAKWRTAGLAPSEDEEKKWVLSTSRVKQHEGKNTWTNPTESVHVHVPIESLATTTPFEAIDPERILEHKEKLANDDQSVPHIRVMNDNGTYLIDSGDEVAEAARQAGYSHIPAILVD